MARNRIKGSIRMDVYLRAMDELSALMWGEIERVTTTPPDTDADYTGIPFIEVLRILGITEEQMLKAWRENAAHYETMPGVFE